MKFAALFALLCLPFSPARADVLAKLKPTAKGAPLALALARRGFDINHRYELVPGLVRVSVPPGTPFETARSSILSTGSFQYVVQDFTRQGAGVSRAARNSSDVPEIPAPSPQPAQWRDDPQETLQYGVGQIGASEVWRTKKAIGSPSVTLAILDSGIDYTHPDLAANLWRDPANAASIGYNFVNESPVPFDDDGHGTHVAGIAAAVGGNGIGISGQCPRCSVMALKVLDVSGKGRDSDILRALDFAVKKGAQVILLAWGGPDDSQPLREALQAVSDAGRTIVTAAGNDGEDLAYAPYYPAKYKLVGMLTVAGLYNTPAGMPFWTNYGSDAQLSSGGADVYSTYPGGRYVMLSGTSMAAAQVAGAAALIKSYRPGMKPADIAAKLRTIIPDPDSTNRTLYGGRPDLVKIFSKL